MSGGWVTMPLNGWTMLAHEEVRAMTTTTGTDLAPRLRAFKHRLDPNPAQATLLAQYAGAARVAYNMLTAHNRAALAASAARRTELAETGLAGPELAARMKAERAADPTLRVASYQSYSTAHLTPLIRRHREAAAAIAAGADPAEAWTDERYAEPWMHTVPRRVLVSGLQNAAKATENWMASASGTRAGARVGLPRFKKKGRSRDSFTIPAPEVIGAAGTPYKRGEPRRGVITDHRHLRLASLGTIRTYDKTSRLVRACRRGAQIRSMTISQAGGRWYASILVADPTPIRTGPSRRQRANGAVGVDLGVKHLAALSTGEVIDNGRPGARQAARLTRLQRAYARTQPGSNRRERVRRQIAALHHGIALRRAGLLHQVSTRLATDFAVVALEDLNVAGMTRSARGTLEAPGRNVAAKSGLNRAILDAGLGMLRRQLDYKTSWAGSQVKMIDRFAPSSKACSRCGTVKSTLSLAERTFECEACHLVIDRDVNAAINIRAWAVQEERGAGVELARGRRESRNGRGAAVSGPPSGGAAGQGRGSVKPAPQGVGMSSRATGWSSQPPSTEGESAERGASALAR